VAVVMAVPGVVAAQRGGGTRSGATQRTELMGDQNARRGPSITSNKLRDLDPLAILIDKHKDMSLADSQVAKLKQMHDQLDEVQTPAYHVLDSLNQQLANIGSNPTGDDQARAQTLNTFVRMVASNMRQRYDSVERDALGLMSDDQKKRADDVLKDSHDELGKLLSRGRN
jgi:hypothetical protein